MSDLNDHNLAKLVSDLVSSKAEAVMCAWEDDVKARWAQQNDTETGAVAADEKPKRQYDYDATPGFRRQSFGAWYKVTANTLADDLRRFHAAPDDITVRLRLQASLKLYGLAGQAFSELVVHKNAVPAQDPLARPALDTSRHRQATVLHADALSDAMASAVLDATSSDPVKSEQARAGLKAIIAAGTDADVQIAATLLAQIGDPFNVGKLNRLAEQIAQSRWQETQGQAGERVPPAASDPAAVTIRRPAAEVVDHGGEDARRLDVEPVRARALGRNNDDSRRTAAKFYGEDD